MPKTLKPPEPTPGDRIRDARIAAGLTQVQLAARLGTTQTNISGTEKGRRNPSLERLCEIARAIGCKPSELDARLTSEA